MILMERVQLFSLPLDQHGKHAFLYLRAGERILAQAPKQTRAVLLFSFTIQMQSSCRKVCRIACMHLKTSSHKVTDWFGRPRRAGRIL